MCEIVGYVNENLKIFFLLCCVGFFRFIERDKTKQIVVFYLLASKLLKLQVFKRNSLSEQIRDGEFIRKRKKSIDNKKFRKTFASWSHSQNK